MVKNINGDIYSDLITSSRSEVYGSNGSRELSSIKYIVIHGTATTSLSSVFSGWSVANNNYSTGRQASANYCVDDIQVVGCIGENYSAWHCGGQGPVYNQNSIGIEHVNSAIGNYADASTYLFSDKTLENGAKLTAEICKRLGIVPSRQTIVPHSDVYATACPQTLNMTDYINRVLKYYNGTGQAQKTTAAAVEEEILKGENDMIAMRSKSGKQGYVAIIGGKLIGLSDMATVKEIEKKGGANITVPDDDFNRIIKGFK